jgi:hypothetical protein
MNSYYENQSSSSGLGSAISDSMDAMIRLPIKMTEGMIDATVDGMRWMTGAGRRTTGSSDRMESTTYGDAHTVRTARSGSGSGSSSDSGSGSSFMSRFTGDSQNDQDLCGDDLKYVVWSIVFTKPGYECVLEPQHEELVNYEADGQSFAAIKIAKFIESARNGRAQKPEAFNDKSYPPSEANGTNGRRSEANAFAANNNQQQQQQQGNEKGFRIPAEDQRFITFLYRVERRLPKQEEEITRVERVTVERTHNTKTAVA